MPANAVELNGCGEKVAKDWVKARSVHCFGESIWIFIDQLIFFAPAHPLIDLQSLFKLLKFEARFY